MLISWTCAVFISYEYWRIWMWRCCVRFVILHNLKVALRCLSIETACGFRNRRAIWQWLHLHDLSNLLLYIEQFVSLQMAQYNLELGLRGLWSCKPHSVFAYLITGHYAPRRFAPKRFAPCLDVLPLDVSPLDVSHPGRFAPYSGRFNPNFRSWAFRPVEVNVRPIQMDVLLHLRMFRSFG